MGKFGEYVRAAKRSSPPALSSAIIAEQSSTQNARIGVQILHREAHSAPNADKNFKIGFLNYERTHT